MKPEHVEVTPKVWKHTFKSDGEEVLTVSLRRPSFEGVQRLERYYARLGAEWKKRWEGALFAQAAAALRETRESSRLFSPWTAALDYSVTRNGGGLLSLYCDAVEWHGTGRPVKTRTAETWDLSTDAPRSISSFFSSKRHWRGDILEQVRMQADARIAGGESLLDADCRARIPTEFRADRFYLDGEDVTVFFPINTLGPYAEGIPEFRIESGG